MVSPQQAFSEALLFIMKSKPFNKVFIGEIVERAGYSKPTFYKYFSDKYDLAFYIHEQIVSDGPNDFRNTDDFVKRNYHALSKMKDNITFYRSVYQSAGFHNYFLIKLHDRSFTGAQRIIGDCNLSQDQIQLLNMWCTCIHSLTIQWILKGAREDIYWIVDMFLRAMPYEIYQKYFKSFDPPSRAF